MPQERLYEEGKIDFSIFTVMPWYAANVDRLVLTSCLSLLQYCECYAGSVKCNLNCRCRGCKNMPVGGFGPRPLGPPVEAKSILVPRGEPIPAVVTSNSIHAANNHHLRPVPHAADYRRVDTSTHTTSNNNNNNHAIEPSWMMDAAQNLVSFVCHA